MHFLNFSLKKFISTILLCFVLFGVFTPITHAIYNPRYDFLKTGGEPIILPFIPPIDYNGQKFEKEIIMDTNANYMQHITLMYSPVVEKYKDTNLIQSDFNALFLYIKPEGLKNNPIILSNKNSEAITYENGDYKEFNDGHFVDSIFYDPDDKKIKIIGGGGQYKNGHVGMYNQAIIAENVDENTPDFMLFVQIQQMYMKNTDGTIRLNSRYMIFREKELGNGELVTSDDAITLVTSTPINRVTPSYFSTNNNSVIPVKMKFDEFLNFCYNKALPGDNEFNERYYACTEELQPLIMNIYGHIWQNQFGLKLIEGNGEIFDDHGLGDKYETIPPFGNGFKGVEYEKCETLEIGCHMRNLGKAIYNGMGSIFSPIINGIKNIWNGFAEVIKNIAGWIGEKIINFFKPVFDFFKAWYEFGESNWNDLQKISFTGTMETCREFNEIDEKQATIASSLVNLISLAIPFAPADGGEVCTFDGRKIVNYKENTKFFDTILIMSAFMSIIFTFTSGISKND